MAGSIFTPARSCTLAGVPFGVSGVGDAAAWPPGAPRPRPDWRRALIGALHKMRERIYGIPGPAPTP